MRRPLLAAGLLALLVLPAAGGWRDVSLPLDAEQLNRTAENAASS